MSSLCHCEFPATTTVTPQQTLGTKTSWSLSRQCMSAQIILAKSVIKELPMGWHVPFFILLCLNDYKTHDTWDETWVHYFNVHTKQAGLQYGCWSNTWDTANSRITKEGNFFSWWLQIQDPESFCNAIFLQKKLKSSQQKNNTCPTCICPMERTPVPLAQKVEWVTESSYCGNGKHCAVGCCESNSLPGCSALRADTVILGLFHTDDT